MITLGKKYKDKITGFKGTATGRTAFLTGCVRILLTRSTLNKEGKPVEEWFDEVNLVTLKGKTPKGLTKQPAGPSKSPPSRSVPTR